MVTICRAAATSILEDDLDVQMDALRHFKLAQTMKTVVAWLLERADVTEVSSVMVRLNA